MASSKTIQRKSGKVPTDDAWTTAEVTAGVSGNDIWEFGNGHGNG